MKCLSNLKGVFSISLKSIFITSLVLASVEFSFSQNNEIKYFDKYWNLTTKENGYYSKSKRILPDSIRLNETIDIKQNLVIERFSEKNEEPVGKWIITDNKERKELDYDFKINEYYKQVKNNIDYTSKEHSIKKLNYIESEFYNELLKFYSNNLFYPYFARRRGIEGVVYISAEISEEGKLYNILILRGIHTCLDKEAVRILRLWNKKFSEILETKSIIGQIVIPVKFRFG
jgi:TonB family protein